MGLRLPKIISDGMVLQQKKRVHIWGFDEPGNTIWISFLGEEYIADVDERGCFSLYCNAISPGGPYSMEIRNSEGEEKILGDIWIGDVFVCTGQSNMEMPMERVKDNYPEEIKVCKNRTIRTFKVAEHVDYRGPVSEYLSGQWIAADDDTIMSFSATAYFFAEQLQRITGVPVGIINVSLGGSPIEAWMSREMLEGYDELLEAADRYAEDGFAESCREQNLRRMEKWHEELDEQDIGLKEGWEQAPACGASPSEEQASVETSHAGWQEVQLPFFFRDTELVGFIGSVWFRREITIPKKHAGKAAKLWLGTIVDSDTVYVNGRCVGHTDYQYPPRKYTVPEGVLKAGANTIVIRVICENGQGRFTPGKEYLLRWNQEEKISLEGKWFYRIGAACRQMEEMDSVNLKATGLYHGMMAPCHNFTIAGIVWYQGESNCRRPENYPDMFIRLILGYREKWKDSVLPWIYVQLPNFSGERYDIDRIGEGSSWQELREMQRKALDIPDTGMVVSMDLGEDNDLHPLNKKELGFRLAMHAAAKLYGLKAECQGPMVKSVTGRYLPGKKEGYQITIECDKCSGGMYAYSKDKGSAILDFQVLDAAGSTCPASAKLSRNKIILKCAELKAEPREVRYCFSNTNHGALIYNRAGFPMSPFRAGIEPPEEADSFPASRSRQVSKK